MKNVDINVDSPHSNTNEQFFVDCVDKNVDTDVDKSSALSTQLSSTQKIAQLSTRQSTQLSTQLSYKKKLTIPVSRDIVQHLLSTHSTTETSICDMLDISLQRYMERFRNAAWDYQATYALCYVLMAVTGKKITVYNIVDR